MDLFVQISLIIVLTTVIAGLMRLIKQPLIIGHIITGLIIGPQFLNLLGNTANIEIFSKIGISILLYIVGISLSPKIVHDIGKNSIIMGIGQVVITTVLGFFICRAFGYSTIESLYVSVALTFSSTIIILKLISDKKDNEKLYAKIAVGFLIVQDVVATTLLLLVSTFSHGGDVASIVIVTLLKGILLTGALYIVSTKLLPKLSDFFASSQEYLFLFSVAWGLGLAVLFQYAGFSIEIGALIAGATLSVSPYAQEIGAKMKPLRDFFIITFFILLGSTLMLENVSRMLISALILSVFVLIGNPIIVIILMSILGYNKRTSFAAGITVAQISEFSLILVMLGVTVGHIGKDILSLVTMVGLITIAGSTYLILYSEKIYPLFAGYLSIFERKNIKHEQRVQNTYEVILFGCNRVGYDFIRLFKNMKQNFLAVDFDPEIVKKISRLGVNCIYGDAEDAELLDELNITNAKVIVSTIPDYDTNAFLLNRIRNATQEAIVILISYNVEEALKLYEQEATYVILPHFIGGQFASELAHKSNFELKRLLAKREEHIDYLKERRALGHTHPLWNHTH